MKDTVYILFYFIYVYLCIMSLPETTTTPQVLFLTRLRSSRADSKGGEGKKLFLKA